MVWDAQCNHYLGLGHDIRDPRGLPTGWENNYLKVQNKYNFEINKSLFIFVH